MGQISEFKPFTLWLTCRDAYADVRQGWQVAAPWEESIANLNHKTNEG